MEVNIKSSLNNFLRSTKLKAKRKAKEAVEAGKRALENLYRNFSFHVMSFIGANSTLATIMLSLRHYWDSAALFIYAASPIIFYKANTYLAKLLKKNKAYKYGFKLHVYHIANIASIAFLTTTLYLGKATLIRDTRALKESSISPYETVSYGIKKDVSHVAKALNPINLIHHKKGISYKKVKDSNKKEIVSAEAQNFINKLHEIEDPPEVPLNKAPNAFKLDYERFKKTLSNVDKNEISKFYFAKAEWALWESVAHRKSKPEDWRNNGKEIIYSLFNNSDLRSLSLNAVLDHIKDQIDLVNNNLNYETINSDKNKSAFLKKVLKNIKPEYLLAYGMTEIFPKRDPKNVILFDTIVSYSGGWQFLLAYPALHDSYLSFGFWQITSLALMEKDGKKGGASLINQALPKELKVPGSVLHLRTEEEIIRAAYLFAIYNLNQLIKDIDISKVKSNYNKFKKALPIYLAVAHHLPKVARTTFKSWVVEKGMKGSYTSLLSNKASSNKASYLAAYRYATKTLKNLKGLRDYADRDIEIESISGYNYEHSFNHNLSHMNHSDKSSSSKYFYKASSRLIYHPVKRGDTYYKIKLTAESLFKDYKVIPAYIKRGGKRRKSTEWNLNKITPGDIIYFRLSKKELKSGHFYRVNKNGEYTYIVKNGDNMFSIKRRLARELGAHINDVKPVKIIRGSKTINIKRVNEANNIHPGDKLIVKVNKSKRKHYY